MSPVPEWRRKARELAPDGIFLRLKFGNTVVSRQVNIAHPDRNAAEYELSKLYEFLTNNAASQIWPEEKP